MKIIIKKGNATITIRGKGEYGGTKIVKFKINSRTVGLLEIKHYFLSLKRG